MSKLEKKKKFLEEEGEDRRCDVVANIRLIPLGKVGIPLSSEI